METQDHSATLAPSNFLSKSDSQTNRRAPSAQNDAQEAECRAAQDYSVGLGHAAEAAAVVTAEASMKVHRAGRCRAAELQPHQIEGAGS